MTEKSANKVGAGTVGHPVEMPKNVGNFAVRNKMVK